MGVVFLPVPLNPPVSMKCTESEDEEPIKGKESQLQLSCFINQEVKYLATGLRLVSDLDDDRHASILCTNGRFYGNRRHLLVFVFLIFPETTGGNHENVRNLGEKRPVYKICE